MVATPRLAIGRLLRHVLQHLRRRLEAPGLPPGVPTGPLGGVSFSGKAWLGV